MKLIKMVLTVVALMTMISTTAMAQELAMKFHTMSLEKVAKRLDPAESARVWGMVKNQVPLAHTTRSTEKSAAGNGNGGSGVSIPATQVPGVMEVTGVPGGEMSVVFQTTQPLVSGATVIFYFTTPDGTQVPMDSFQLFGADVEDYSGWNISADLWKGTFRLWQPGWTKFSVVVVSPNGKLMYTSATVAVNACCSLDGPVDRADVSVDGSSISVQGFFNGDTFATLNGNPVQLNFGQSIGGKTSLYTDVKIPLDPTFGQGQMVLTICSYGSCSTRIIYVSSPAKG